MAATSVNTVLGEFRRTEGGFEFHGRLGDLAVVLDTADGETAAALARRVHTAVGDPAVFARRLAAELADSFSPEGPDEVEVWENDEAVISAAEFARRLRPGSVTAADDSDLRISFDDDGMFGGHTVWARVDDAGTMTDAGIAG